MQSDSTYSRSQVQRLLHCPDRSTELCRRLNHLKPGGTETDELLPHSIRTHPNRQIKYATKQHTPKVTAARCITHSMANSPNHNCHTAQCNMKMSLILHNRYNCSTDAPLSGSALIGHVRYLILRFTLLRIGNSGI